MGGTGGLEHFWGSRERDYISTISKTSLIGRVSTSRRAHGLGQKYYFRRNDCAQTARQSKSTQFKPLLLAVSCVHLVLLRCRQSPTTQFRNRWNWSGCAHVSDFATWRGRNDSLSPMTFELVFHIFFAAGLDFAGQT